MADSKISALPASTTPLAGTEVLPIVQSGATKQVSAANFTAGRAVSALSYTSTSGFNLNTSYTSANNKIYVDNTSVGGAILNFRPGRNVGLMGAVDGVGLDCLDDSGANIVPFVVRGNPIYLSGSVGINVSGAVSYALQVNTDSAGKPGVGGLWTVVSDERIKTDIVPADLSRCYDIVKQVGLKYFAFAPDVYSEDQVNDKHNLGWIAQDVQKVFSKAVSVKPFTLQNGDVIEDCLDLNSGQLIAALYGSVQMLMAKVEALEAKA
jgi:hypothetical protein